MIPNLFPSFLLSSASRSLPTVQVPSLAELRKQAELLASSIPPLPSLSSSGTKAKGEINVPQQSRSKGLPIPSLNHAQLQSTSWYIHPHPPVYTEAHKEEGGEKEKEKEYIDEIDIGHGYDHIHRLGKNASSPANSTNNKLWKTWNGGFRPVRSQEVIPDESGRGVRAKKYGMEGSKSYAECLYSLTQPSIQNMRDDGNSNDENKSTWLEWITCKSCN
ncbi:hypothetical protein I302_108884 [Kwoniella bestiolae CBS 10118]|uniref:Uncharacterized protein n=1 Tax=Kwoniella bestiolae CBS 10118 TaxID=1296100 RepID=A0A1B9FUD4_9TREE|nr:hypothetical protein I302_08021 [Kwoniella bestiolae CBS 10118]OCF22374.1 hypothetical protein I302_08021 [Kwoniella bestiolae CBS 10118]